MQQSEPLFAGAYRLVQPLGSGSSAEVFVAEQVQLARRVVIKILHPHVDEQLADRMRLEAQALAKVRHDNVVAVYDFGLLADGRAYLVMEYLAGESLEQYVVAKGGALPANEAMLIAREVLSGLHAIHQAGFVHRDVKPHNLFRCSDGRIKVLDLGITKLLQELTDIKALELPTGDGAVIGTPKYMAPEQALGEPVDHRADLYAVGVVLYRMVTGMTPFEHIVSVAELLHAQAYEEPRAARTVAPDRVSARLDAVLARALAKRPAQRYPDALAMAADLVVLDHSYELLASELGFDSAALDAEPSTASTRPNPRAIDATLPMESAPVNLLTPTPMPAPGTRAAGAAPLAPPPGDASITSPTLPSAGRAPAPRTPATPWRDPIAALLFVAAALCSAVVTIALGWGGG